MPHLLIVSDDTNFIEQVHQITGYEIVVATDETVLFENKISFFAVFFDHDSLLNPQEMFYHFIYWRCRVIAVTTTGDTECAIEYLKQGARDYLVKPTHPALIQKRLELLQEVAEAKDRLHTGIHDAKQPLSSILGYASLLKNPDRYEKIPPEMRQSMFDSIHSGAVRLRDMLDDFDGFGI
jgi:DNA-binding NtrC family response regulator